MYAHRKPTVRPGIPDIMIAWPEYEYLLAISLVWQVPEIPNTKGVSQCTLIL